MRLCTADELASDKCCETGCNYDDMRVWQTGGVSKSGNNNQGKKSKTYCIGFRSNSSKMSTFNFQHFLGNAGIYLKTFSKQMLEIHSNKCYQYQ